MPLAVTGLCVQYTQRRDFFIDCLVEKFHIEIVPVTQETRFMGSERYAASEKFPVTWYNSEKTQKRRTLFSFVPPSSGMFVWVSMRAALYKFSFSCPT